MLISAQGRLQLFILVTFLWSGVQSAISPCRSHEPPCKHGGLCTETPEGGYHCTCSGRWDGRNCTDEVPTCADQPCQNNGECVDLPNRQYQCTCLSGFIGRSCEFVDPCASNPCHPDAECISNNLGGKECHCPWGRWGEDCSEDIDECAIEKRSPCEHNGYCINLPGSFRCECPSGYRGFKCEEVISICESTSCANGGHCIDKGDHFECQCPIGYEGQQCEIDVNDCSESPCQNKGYCEDLVGAFKCHCSPGWKGRFCQVPTQPCDLKPCLHNATCEDRPPGSSTPGYICHCPAGFQGDRCEINVDDCLDVQCANHGICIDGSASWHCQCPPGFFGRLCDKESQDCERYPLNPGCNFMNPLTEGGACSRERSCLHGGICKNPFSPFCECPLEWTGEHCEVPVCSADFCANEGKCRPVLDSPGTEIVPSIKHFKCVCPAKFRGERCLEKVDTCQVDFCQNGASCKESSVGPICDCGPGYGGSRCEEALTTCDQDPCLNGGACSATNNASEPAFVCQCPTAFQGIFCETKLTCSHLKCGRHGMCVETDAEDVRCICHEGWKGSYCEHQSKKPEVESKYLRQSKSQTTCDDEPCSNQAVCVPTDSMHSDDSISKFKCLCDTAFGNFTGDRCDQDVNECILSTNPCQNHATCMNTIGSFVCKCPTGFTGGLCELQVDPCDLDHGGPICGNGGDCRTVNGVPTCECPDGFSGANCETEYTECENKPCENGGICISFFSSYACQCPDGFRGRHCQYRLEFSFGNHSTSDKIFCIDNQCQNGGKCSHLSDSVDCECRPGFYGRYCEVSVNLCHQILTADSTLFGGLVGNKRTLSLTAATASVAAQLPMDEKSGTTMGRESIFSLLHLSKTQMGPCYPDGTVKCVPRPIDFSCVCREGFHGRYCEQRRDFCAEAEGRIGGQPVCLNGGKCLNGHSSFKTTDERKSTQEDKFMCQCPTGFGGRQCEHTGPFCDKNICKNGGICEVATSQIEGTEMPKIYCKCPKGLGGIFCEINLVNECAKSGICLNGGTCIDGYGNYSCSCPNGVCGKRCELSGFMCAVELVDDPVKWPGQATDKRLCEIAECTKKAGNGVCDRECDRLACKFDAGECLYPVAKQAPLLPFNQPSQILSNQKQLSLTVLPKLTTPWMNCSNIVIFGIPCHLRFGDGKCDPECASEACLFDGWDCMKKEKSNETNSEKQTTLKIEKENEVNGVIENHLKDLLILLVDADPMSLVKHDSNVEGGFLAGLRNLLRMQLRIKRQPKTGLPMIYPIKISKGDERKHAFVHQTDFWSTPEGANLIQPNLSVTQLINRQNSLQTLKDLLSQLTRQQQQQQQQDKPIRRFRRSLEDVSTRTGSRVFLEIENNQCTTCFHDVDTAAQFISAAIRTRRYTSPISILSIQTASPEAMETLIGLSKGTIPDRVTWIYCLSGLICTVLLTSLFGVLYGVLQRRSQVGAHGSDRYDLGTGYEQKSLMKKIRTTSIWYPGSSNREGRHHHQSGIQTVCAEGAMSLQARNRAMAIPQAPRASLPMWRRETATHFGRSRINRSVIRGRMAPPLLNSSTCCESFHPSFVASTSATSSRPLQVYTQNTISTNATDTIPDLTLSMPLMAAAGGIPQPSPQIDIDAYFTSIMEHLVTGDGLMEISSRSSSEGLNRKLEYLRQIEFPHSSSCNPTHLYPSTNPSPRPAPRQKRPQTLLSQVLASALPETGETLLHLAARNNCPSALSALLNAGADAFAVDNKGSTVLLTAISASAAETVRTLLASQTMNDLPRMFSACPTEDKSTPLIQAVKLGDVDMIDLLLQTMAHLIPEPIPGPPMNPTLPPYSVAMTPNRRGPIDPRYTRYTTMSSASGSAAIPQSANESNISTNSFGVNATDGEGRTALHWAAATEQPKIVRLLINAGASHDVQTMHEETPLTLAAREGSMEVCSLLLAAGANAEIADYLDRTPLQLAAQNGHTRVVQLLQNCFSQRGDPSIRRPYASTAPQFYPHRQWQSSYQEPQQQQQQHHQHQQHLQQQQHQPYSEAAEGYESFLMQLQPLVTSTTAGPTKEQQQQSFFDCLPYQAETCPVTGIDISYITSPNGQFNNNNNNNNSQQQLTQQTPSSDTESPANWSSPSPTAISPIPKMTLTTTSQLHQQHQLTVCSPSTYSSGSSNHIGFYPKSFPHCSGPISYYPEDCIKLEPRVF